MFKQHLPAPQHIWPRGRRCAAKGPRDASLMGKSIQQMDVWGLVTLIYQLLMPRFVSRVPRCCRGKIGANGVIRLLAQGSGSSWGSGRAAGALPAAGAFWRGWQGGTEQGVHCTRVYMHATTASKQGMEMGTSFWGCSWPIGSQGFYRAPNTAGAAPGPWGRTCSFTFTPSTVSTLF